VADHQVNGTVADLVSYFNKYLKKNKAHFTRQEYELHEHLGSEMLKTYFDQRIDNWKTPDRSELEYKVNHAEHKGVPIKGVLDRLDFFKDMVVVTDYKTGKASNARMKVRPPKKDGDIGGDYWRQLVFYKILIDAAPELTKPMPVGYLDFVRPSSDGTHKLEKIIITDEHEQVVSDQIVDTYHKIMNHEFDTGCEEPDCEWCNMVKSQGAEQGVGVLIDN
jgi:DNA helicase-2/ATP-dependent DNA helicase PcrA